MTPSALRSWFAREHPGWNWDNRCAGAAYQTCVATGTAVRTYPTATAARNASMIRSRDISKAPAGAFHFWEYWATLGGVYANYGHVALELGGGWALMSNPEASDEQWGIALGVTNVAEWTRRRAGVLTYLGWSNTYGDNTASIAAGSSGAASGENSNIELKEWDEMATREDVKSALREVLAEQARLGQYSLVPILDDGNIYLVNNENQKRVRVETPYHVQLIMRRLSNEADDTMLDAESRIVDGYLAAVAGAK